MTASDVIVSNYLHAIRGLDAMKKAQEKSKRKLCLAVCLIIIIFNIINVNITITILNLIHLPVSYLKLN
jgi:cell division protein FtsW (lipid II flippase)